ncbi:MAG: hypothetical protein Q8K26_03700, partial [Candidatus Gracilibacteria bacterium]|nr:hypothetical protein [Candidatus Gracilibacteria bacterium]
KIFNMFSPTFDSTSKLGQSINQYGGKNGGLVLLGQEQSLLEHILPMIVLDNEKFPNSNDLQTVLSWAQKFPDGIILRLSNPADWDGQVGTMPGSIRVRNLADIQKIIEKVWINHRDRENKLIEYGIKEGILYDSTKTTLSISPYLKGIRVTITEHPNRPLSSHIHVDTAEDFETFWLYKSGELNGLKGFADEKTTRIHETSKELLLKIRETAHFSDDRSYQFEAIYSNDDIYLVQGRDFAKIQLVDTRMPNYRVYGCIDITKQYTAKLLHSNAHIGLNLEQESLIESTRDYALVILDNHSRDIGTLYPSSNDKAYLVPLGDCNPALSHQNTRFVKAMLQKGGVANLVFDKMNLKHSDVFTLNEYGTINSINSNSSSKLLEDLDLPSPDDLFKL